MTTNKRLLYIAHRTPYPPNRGYRIRSFHWIDYLARRCDLDIAFLADETVTEETLEALQSRSRQVIWDFLPPWRRQFQAAISLIYGHTATEGAFWSRSLFSKIRQLCRQRDYHAIIVYCSSMVQYIEYVNHRNICVDLVDVDSQKWHDYAQSSSPTLRWIYRLEARRLRELERRLSRRASLITLATSPERDLYLSFCPDARAVVVENGVDIKYFCPTYSGSTSTFFNNRLTFVGALHYYPNVDGITWFIKEIWPTLGGRFSNLELYVVGSGADQRLRQLIAATPGVFLASDVPDVRPFLAGAIAIVPLRIARGVQNKVLEAMAMGCPTIASPVALEGIAVTPGAHVMQADTWGDWLAAVTKLLESPEFRTKLGLAARQHIVEHYTWESKLTTLNHLLRVADE